MLQVGIIPINMTSVIEISIFYIKINKNNDNNKSKANINIEYLMKISSLSKQFAFLSMPFTFVNPKTEN